METFLLGCGNEPLAQDLLWWIIGQFEIVDAGVDGWVAVVITVHFADNCKPGLEIGQASWWKRGTPSGELEEKFPLISGHTCHNVHKPLETGAAIQNHTEA